MVIPAKARIQGFKNKRQKHWIPACAGMTKRERRRRKAEALNPGLLGGTRMKKPKHWTPTPGSTFPGLGLNPAGVTVVKKPNPGLRHTPE
jgi:hypothetical protein